MDLFNLFQWKVFAVPVVITAMICLYVFMQKREKETKPCPVYRVLSTVRYEGHLWSCCFVLLFGLAIIFGLITHVYFIPILIGFFGYFFSSKMIRTIGKIKSNLY